MPEFVCLNVLPKRSYTFPTCPLEGFSGFCHVLSKASIRTLHSNAPFASNSSESDQEFEPSTNSPKMCGLWMSDCLGRSLTSRKSPRSPNDKRSHKQTKWESELPQCKCYSSSFQRYLPLEWKAPFQEMSYWRVSYESLMSVLWVSYEPFKWKCLSLERSRTIPQIRLDRNSMNKQMKLSITGDSLCRTGRGGSNRKKASNFWVGSRTRETCGQKILAKYRR